jgi:hypothetical protein
LSGALVHDTLWLVIKRFFQFCCCAIATAVSVLPDESYTPPRGADELYWVPTLEQGLEMAQATGRPLFLMGYSLVGDGTTYTKLGDTFCKGVF